MRRRVATPSLGLGLDQLLFARYGVAVRYAVLHEVGDASRDAEQQWRDPARGGGGGVGAGHEQWPGRRHHLASLGRLTYRARRPRPGKTGPQAACFLAGCPSRKGEPNQRRDRDRLARAMVISYLDTSAAMKLLVEDAESDALCAYLQSPVRDSRQGDGRELVASWLLHVELHCAANRHPEDVDLASVGTVLDVVTLVDLTRGDLLTAGSLPGGLRSNDAMHLAAALRIGVDEMITYDQGLADAATAAGIAVVGPRSQQP